jgi:hypothetical protein
MFRLFGPQTYWDSLSTSDQLASVNQAQSRPFGQGIEIAWDITGPALQHWRDEVLPIADIICQRDKKKIFAGVDWKGKFELIPFMIGRTWATAKPTLVIRIYDRNVIGRLGSRLRKEERFRRTGFCVVGQIGDVVFKAGERAESIQTVVTPPVEEHQGPVPVRDVLPAQPDSSPSSLFGQTILV